MRKRWERRERMKQAILPLVKDEAIAEQVVMTLVKMGVQEDV